MKNRVRMCPEPRSEIQGSANVMSRIRLERAILHGRIAQLARGMFLPARVCNFLHTQQLPGAMIAATNIVKSDNIVSTDNRTAQIADLHQQLCAGFDQRTAFEAFPLTELLLKSALAN
jgi:hypothetical protein